MRRFFYVLHDSSQFFVNRKLKLFEFINPKKFFLLYLKTSLSWIYYSNIILYTEKDRIIFEENRKFSKWQNIFFCSCCIEKQDNKYDYNCKRDIIAILRFENEQKNLKFMDEVSKNLDNPIHVYGEGIDKHLFQNTVVHDKITDENLKYDLLSKSSLFIMTSNHEGFGFSIVEALSMGLPIIIRDTFPHATTLVKHNYNGLVFDKNATPVEVANGIKELLKKPDLLKEMSKNSIKIYEENFTIDKFNEAWKKILKIE